MSPDVLIFTDGSLKRAGNKTYGGYGYAICNVKKKKYATGGGKVRGKSSLYCELYALYAALKCVRKIKPNKKKVKIVIVTDSKLMVESFNKWIHTVWDLSDYDNWKKADGMPVKYQEIMKLILAQLENNPYEYRFMHMNSHRKPTEKEFSRIADKAGNQDISVNFKTAETFIFLNDVCDKIASKYAFEAMKDKDSYYDDYIHLGSE